MQSPPEHTLEDDATSNNGSASTRNPPLVIVSERGRHSEASRRIVRAQAARASAAQSRETRARNRGSQQASQASRAPVEAPAPNHVSRQSHAQQSHQKPQRQQPPAPDPTRSDDNLDSDGILKPLVNWITNILHLTATSLVSSAAALAAQGQPQLKNASDARGSGHGYIADSGVKMEEVQVDRGLLNRRLPIALPRGFAMLQTRINISDDFMVLLSRTACFDYASIGVEGRLNELLCDIVMNTATSAILDPTKSSDHPISKHLRLACVCLTIFQGQRVDGATFAGNQHYDLGLQAAWNEAMVLDHAALKDQKSAEAALWAVFVISVTCGSTATFYHQLLHGLMHDLQLAHWSQVRNVLLDFIYPGSFIDAPMHLFYQQLHRDRGFALGAPG
ncbi:hypothetical protein BST61_g5345 [Cercospora zeina]